MSFRKDKFDASKATLAELDERRKKLEKKLQRSEKWTRRAINVVLPILFVVLGLFEVFMAGYHIHANDMENAVLSGLFAFMFIPLPLFRFLDVKIDADMGTKFREMVMDDLEKSIKKHQEELDQLIADEKAAEAESIDTKSRNGASSSLQNAMRNIAKDLPPHLRHIVDEVMEENEGIDAVVAAHERMLAIAADKCVEDVVVSELEKRNPGKDINKLDRDTYESIVADKEVPRKIEAMFEEMTGHKVNIRWDNDGWAIDINMDHDHLDHDHATVDKVTKKKAAPKKADKKGKK